MRKVTHGAALVLLLLGFAACSSSEENKNLPPSVDAGTLITLPSQKPGPGISPPASITFELTGTASDTDGSVVSYQWTQVSGPTVSLINPTASVVSGYFPYTEDIVEFVLRLTVTDNNGASASDDVTVRYDPTGTPVSNGTSCTPTTGPGLTVNAGPDINAIVGDAVEINAEVSNATGSLVSTEWRRTSGIALGVSPDGVTTLNLSFVVPPLTTESGIVERVYKITVVDQAANTAVDCVTISIDYDAAPPTPGNSPPSVNAGVDQRVDAGTVVNLSGTASDSDGTINTIAWEQTAGPTVTLINANTLNASFTAPDVASTTTFTFRLTATDNIGDSRSDSVVITVDSTTNVPPIVNAGADQRVNAGTLVNLSGTASDSDGTITTIAWEQTTGSTVTLINANSLNASFSAPDVGSTTTFTFRLTVTDDAGDSRFDTVVITVDPTATNVPPTANAGIDQNVLPLASVTLSGSGTDSDGSIVTYRWLQLTGPTVTLRNANSAIASFTAPDVSSSTSLSFRLTVTDNNDASDFDDVVITVSPPFSATLSGTVTSMSGHTTDSDVNSTSAPYRANDSFGEAQDISSAVVIGGYANQPGQGPVGRSRTNGDINDYFYRPVAAGQVVTLIVGDTSSSSNDLDLYVYDEFGALVDASLGAGAVTEKLNISNAGNYFIRVNAANGASNYVLTIDTAVASAAFSSSGTGWSTQGEFVTNEAVIKFAQPVTTASRGFSAAAVISDRASSLGLTKKAGATDRSMLVQLPAPATKVTTTALDKGAVAPDAGLQARLDTLLAIKTLAQQADVEYVSPNYIFRSSAIPNDANYSIQWHYPMIHLEEAWDLTKGDASVVVAVIDNGVLPGHPDLSGKLIDGYDFVSDPTTALDGNGIDPDPTDPGDGQGIVRSGFHGTHVSGTIAAATNNSIGVAGVGWNVKVMPLRALGVDTTTPGNSAGTLYDIEQALLYAAGLSNDSGTLPSKRADVVNLSLGSPSNNLTAPPAFVSARAAGVIIVAAAGNSGSSQTSIPAAFNGVVSVSAVTSTGALASYSNYGTTIDVAAPGGGGGNLIISTTADDTGPSLVYNYGGKAGTSMASPHVAGVAALMKSVYPGLTPAEFDSLLSSGQLTDDLGPLGRDNSFGYGLINAQKAVQAAITANGGVTPSLSVNPTEMNFGVTQTSLVLELTGNSVTSVTSVTQDSGGWLSVSPLSVDGSGLGTYNVNVNRGVLTAGSYSATISVASNAGSFGVPVSMVVLPSALTDNAGFQLIELRDAADPTVLIDKVGVSAVAGKYSYSFTDVPEGLYRIYAYSDSDNDLANDVTSCEVGDACGTYPSIGSSLGEISVDGSSSTITGLDFESGYHTTPVSP